MEIIKNSEIMLKLRLFPLVFGNNWNFHKFRHQKYAYKATRFSSILIFGSRRGMLKSPLYHPL